MEPPTLLGVDHIELYVGNATTFSHFLASGFGLARSSYAGLETGVRDRSSYVHAVGETALVVTAPLGPEGEIAEHVRTHGDGVRAVAFQVADVNAAFESATALGAQPVGEPEIFAGPDGEVRVATVATYGETVHRLVDRSAYRGVFLPGYEPEHRPSEEPVARFSGIDHVVGNVELGSLERWVSYYERVFGFSELIGFSDRDVSTEYSALMSKVMSDGSGRIKLPLNEPASSSRRSQIEEFLVYYGGPGVQHIALETDDIVEAMRTLRRNGVRFLSTPASYYEGLAERVPALGPSIHELASLGILADSDDDGYLLQVFSRPVSDRPTLFFELIERHGSRGFGEGNFKALFEAIEREQDRRGNL